MKIKGASKKTKRIVSTFLMRFMHMETLRGLLTTGVLSTKCPFAIYCQIETMDARMRCNVMGGQRPHRDRSNES
jgi:hypothetical protein